MQKKSVRSENLIGVGGSTEDEAAKIWGQLVVGLLRNFNNRILGGWLSLILDCGAEAWFRGQKGYVNKLQTLQNTATRRILGAFRTVPNLPLELEASLPPTAIRLQQTCRKYALQTMTVRKCGNT